MESRREERAPSRVETLVWATLPRAPSRRCQPQAPSGSCRGTVGELSGRCRGTVGALSGHCGGASGHRSAVDALWGRVGTLSGYCLKAVRAPSRCCCGRSRGAVGASRKSCRDIVGAPSGRRGLCRGTVRALSGAPSNANTVWVVAAGEKMGAGRSAQNPSRGT